ncbi:MAG: replication initiator, partial [Steroidobacteraceae bacterium]
EALRASASRVRVACPDESGGMLELVFGDQFDARPIRGGDDDALSDDRVAGYVAKYSTKAAECVGTLDRAITCRDCKGSGLLGACPRCGGTGLRVPLEDLPVSGHARALISTAWRLGVLPQYEGLRLRAWAHQCGYGGHFCTKSRVYSVTRGALVDARAKHAAKQAGGAALPADAVTQRDWKYSGSGYQSLVEAQFAAQVREAAAQNRQDAREALADDAAYQGSRSRRARRRGDAA